EAVDLQVGNATVFFGGGNIAGAAGDGAIAGHLDRVGVARGDVGDIGSADAGDRVHRLLRGRGHAQGQAAADQQVLAGIARIARLLVDLAENRVVLLGEALAGRHRGRVGAEVAE